MTSAVKIVAILAGTVVTLGLLATGAVWGAAAVVDLRGDVTS